MLTASQIGAFIGLLMAFGVDQPTINNVQAMLEAPTVQSRQVGGIGAPASEKPREIVLEEEITRLRAEVRGLSEQLQEIDEKRKSELALYPNNQSKRNTITSYYARFKRPLAEEMSKLRHEIELLTLELNAYEDDN